MTFKIVQPVELPASFCLVGTFVRCAGWSVESIRGPRELVPQRVVELTSRLDIQRIHVWPRDRAVPGDGGFEPGASAESNQLAAEISAACAHHPTLGNCIEVNSDADFGQRVLDCIVVDPDFWWLGRHVASNVPGRWPGGSRAFPVPNR